MHVGVVVLVVANDGFDDLARLLAGGRVIEINQRMPMNRLLQNGKIAAKGGPIIGRFGRHAHPSFKSGPAATWPRRSSCSGSIGDPRPARRWPHPPLRS